MAITTLAMVATVFVGNLYETKDRPVPAWVRTVILHYAASLLRYCTRCVDASPGGGGGGFEAPSPPQQPPPAPSVPPSRDETIDPDDDDDDDDVRSTPSGAHRTPYRLAALQDARSDNGVDGGEVYRPRSPSSSPGVRLLVRGSSALGRATVAVGGRRRQRGAGAQAAARSYSKDWTNVGAVCDRLFFWLCLCLAVTTTIVLFQPLISRPSSTVALDSVYA